MAQVPFWAFYEIIRCPEDSIVKVSFDCLDSLKFDISKFSLLFLQKLKGVFQPNDQWGPKSPRIKDEWMKVHVQREIEEVLQS